MEQKIIRKVLHIEGMTCTSCETRIENALKKLDGVVEAKGIYSSSNVYVTYDISMLGLDLIIEAIEKMDYKVKNIPLNEENRNAIVLNDVSAGNAQNKQNTGQMIGIAIIIFAVYTIIDNTVGFNFIPQIDQSMGYGILFVIGLLTSLHCIAMCGGINMSVCIRYKTEDGSGSKLAKLKPSALYNLGRVISYTVIGGIVGALGSVISFSGTAKGIVAVFSGVFMVVMGLNMLNIFPWLRKINPRLPKFLGKKVHNNAGKKGPLIIGLLNGLMPCGPLQAMQLYALGTGSFAAGAISMFLFSIGTIPLMFGFGAVSSLLSSKFTHRMLKVSAVLVIILGVIMLNRGLNLSGFGIVSAAAISKGSGSIAKVDGEVQYVTTKLESGRYSPIVVQKGIPVKWTIKVEKGDLNGCNNPVTIPEYNFQIKLVQGDNIIEFTPKEEGNIIYTCWMGMISSNIKVVADINNVTNEDMQNINADAAVQIPTDEVAIGELKDGIQYVSINVNDNEFSPAVVILEKGVETIWVINGNQLNIHNNTLIFPEYNAKLRLDEGENELKFIPEGDFTFQCTLGKLNGYVKVVEDIKNIDIEDIKNEIENYQPSNGGFGSSSRGGATCH